MVVDNIKNSHHYLNISYRLRKALLYLKENDFSTLDSGKHETEENFMFMLVNEYSTKEDDLNILEAHRKYIDLQYIISGEEIIKHEILDKQQVHKEYDKENDYILYKSKAKTEIILSQGMFAIFFPNDLHLPGIASNQSQEVKKIVLKVLID